jgi:hypothetical protein
MVGEAEQSEQFEQLYMVPNSCVDRASSWAVSRDEAVALGIYCAKHSSAKCDWGIDDFQVVICLGCRAIRATEINANPGLLDRFITELQRISPQLFELFYADTNDLMTQAALVDFLAVIAVIRGMSAVDTIVFLESVSTNELHRVLHPSLGPLL